jgi:large subunit ribosomal protein L44e
VSLYKKGRERALSAGRRRYDRKEAGYGSQPKPVQKRFAKVTKKQSLRLKCQECEHVTVREGIRLKKLEIT